MPKPSDMISMNLDGIAICTASGQTILDAARQNDIYIPTLCAHKDLAPFGGCRMCIVEVEGMRGFPTACTTIVAEGMIARTQTAGLQAARAEILQLILSEHPVGCLLCEERSGCGEYMGTLHKAGVTSGCGNCPADTQCELQDVVAWVGLKEMKYPVRYRGHRVEKEDPFFDRDYNLCILCGRCVRACQDLRVAGTLAFRQRGPAMVVGPAFARTHIEAGCEFCGTCVDVCPTGALSEKSNKWKGKPDREVITTCPMCGLGCQLRLQVQREKVIGVKPVDGSDGKTKLLCVKGRFGVTEFVNGHERLTHPYHLDGNTRLPLTWDEAATRVAEMLSSCPPERFGMVISADATNEDLYIAQKFARVVMHSQRIDTLARNFFGSGYGPYLGLAQHSATTVDLESAAVVLCVGADTQLDASVVGVSLKKALRLGARLVTINSRPHNLARIADLWLKPERGQELAMMESLVRGSGVADPGANGKLRKLSEEQSYALKLLKSGKPLVIVVGTDWIQHPDSARLFELLNTLADKLNARILPILPQGNLPGSILMGAHPEILPGGRPSLDGKAWNSEQLRTDRNLQVLYVVGDLPHHAERLAEHVIVQHFYPPESDLIVDLVLPSATFTEVDGTMIRADGLVEHIHKAVNPPGQATADWEILCRIARAMGVEGFNYADVSEVQREIAQVIPGFNPFQENSAVPEWLGIARPTAIGAPAAMIESHHGISLARRVAGFRPLYQGQISEIGTAHFQSEPHASIVTGVEVER